MELKQWDTIMALLGEILLIVPYGIETLLFVDGMLSALTLLIVPYGIETTFFLLNAMKNTRLLIVPYGIETTK